MNQKRQKSIHDRRHKAIVTAITTARKDAGLSQRELAEAVGLRQPDVSKIETHERRLDVVEFADILAFLASRTNQPSLPFDLFKQLTVRYRS
jgi:transcriptional regulator with XRE-family HTH domain